MKHVATRANDTAGEPASAARRRKLKLRLYITGSTPKSAAALDNVRAVCAALTEHELEIVDVLAAPERARADAVLVTPTLLRVAPAPVCRVVGTLEDVRRVLDVVGVAEDAA